ncbi:SAM-dependent methyltransferase [bacterium CPR1]|nr:SAM-dependent methyltransferase [bacterium CPR1]
MTFFDEDAERYDAWFDSPDGRILFQNELEAIRLVWSDAWHPSLEVGVGTGRFAQALKVDQGLDPAAGALLLAERRGIRVHRGVGESLPFADASLAGVLMITTLCFADGPSLLREAARVLRPGGSLLVADIPADSSWGRHYQRKKKEGHPIYSLANLATVEEHVEMIRAAGLTVVGFSSTLLESQPGSPRAEPPRMGRLEGAGFVCILAEKSSERTGVEV